MEYNCLDNIPFFKKIIKRSKGTEEKYACILFNEIHDICICDLINSKRREASEKYTSILSATIHYLRSEV